MAKLMILFMIFTVIMLFSTILVISVLKNLFAKALNFTTKDTAEVNPMDRYKDDDFVPSNGNFF